MQLPSLGFTVVGGILGASVDEVKDIDVLETSGGQHGKKAD